MEDTKTCTRTKVHDGHNTHTTLHSIAHSSVGCGGDHRHQSAAAGGTGVLAGDIATSPTFDGTSPSSCFLSSLSMVWCNVAGARTASGDDLEPTCANGEGDAAFAFTSSCSSFACDGSSNSVQRKRAWVRVVPRAVPTHRLATVLIMLRTACPKTKVVWRVHPSGDCNGNKNETKTACGYLIMSRTHNTGGKGQRAHRHDHHRRAFRIPGMHQT